MIKKQLPVYKEFEKKVEKTPKEFFMQFSKKEILTLLSTHFVRSHWWVYCKTVSVFDVYSEENCWFASKTKEEILDEFTGEQNIYFDEFFLKSKEIIEKIHKGKDRKEYFFGGLKVNDNYRNFQMKYFVFNPAEYFKKFTKKELLKLFNTKYIKMRWNFCLDIGKEDITEENCEWAKDNDEKSLSYDFVQDGLSEEVIMNAKIIIDRIRKEGDNFKYDYDEYPNFQKKFNKKAKDFFMEFSKEDLIKMFSSDFLRKSWNICLSTPLGVIFNKNNCSFVRREKEEMIEWFLNSFLDEKIIIKAGKILVSFEKNV